MEIIIIYGPPASGKMTITKELCKITKAKFLPHNLIFNLIIPIFEKKLNVGEFWDLYEEIKINIVKTAKQKDVSLILTEIYDKSISNIRIKRFIAKLNKLKIKYRFVKIGCTEKELLKRVIRTDRKKHLKISSKREYRKLLKDSSLNEVIPFVKNFVIDNSNLSAKKVAQLIKKELKLK